MKRRATLAFVGWLGWLGWLTLVGICGWLPAGRVWAAGCTVASPGLAFGSYNPLQALPLDGAADVVVSCTAATAYTVALSAGTGSFAGRRMAGGRSGLTYNLFLDGSRSVVWGDGSSGSGVASGISADGGGAVHHTVYGRIPAGQNVFVGIYADAVVMQVSY